MKSLRIIKNNIFRILIILSAILGVVACTAEFDRINTPLDPIDDDISIEIFGEGIHLGDSITPKELEDLQKNISNMGTILRKFTYEGVYNDYQTTTNLTHDIYAGYFTNMNPSWVTGTPCYMHNPGWSDRRWEHFYKDRTQEYGKLARAFWFVGHDFESGTSPYLNAFYMVRIYYAFLISMQTDTYGDIPLTDEHLQGAEVKDHPQYLSQKEVYKTIFALLEDAVNNMDPNKNNIYHPKENDKCYNGDVEKWIRFGNTLRLRLALRIANVDPTEAQKQGEAALAHPAGLMAGQGDNMRTIPKYAPTDLGGEDTGGDENIHALCSYKWHDAGLHKDLEIAYRTLSERLDPRCKISWYRPLLENSDETNPKEKDEDFLGSHPGDNDVQKPSFKYSLLRSYGSNTKILNDEDWFGYSRESVWLSYAESKFLLAEAALREWSGTTKSPLDYFMEGISASMQYYTISYGEEQNYINGMPIFKDFTQNPFILNDKEGMLEQIITQKWLAVFPNGNEGWAEFRRTDYPSFLQLPLYNTSGGSVPEGKFIKRIQYPLNEVETNQNYPGTVPTGTRLWWDVADTNDNGGKREKPNNFR